MSASCKGAHFPRDVTLHAVFLYLHYGMSYSDLEEAMARRGVTVDYASLNRWVERYAGQLAEDGRRRKRLADRSWRMDETYARARGDWAYLYRAADKFGMTLDFMLSERRNKPAAIRFFARYGGERTGTQDSHRREYGQHRQHQGHNRMLKWFPIEMVRIRYLGDLVEQDHRS